MPSQSAPVVLVLGAAPVAPPADGCDPLAQRLGADTVFTHTVRNALASGLPVVVVTTPGWVEEASRLVARRDIVVLAPVAGQPAPGLGDAVAAGVGARPRAAGWMTLPAHMPRVRADTLRRVAHHLPEQVVVHAQHRGQRGHPLGFGAGLFSELVHLQGHEGPQRLVARYPALGVEVDDPGVLQLGQAETSAMAWRRTAQPPKQGGLRG